MNCPLCGEHRLEAKFSHGIEVDVCPNCKGVWLDRGELERLFASAGPADGSVAGRTESPTIPVAWAPAPAAPRSDGGVTGSLERDRHERRRDGGPRPSSARPKPKKKKKKSWADLLEDVFEEVLDL